VDERPVRADELGGERGDGPRSDMKLAGWPVEDNGHAVLGEQVEYLEGVGDGPHQNTS
jgi:hypothetical protein